MDSITQFALGAALGELVAGREKNIGGRALLWGGIGGTLPDLDVLLNPFFTELERLSVHRGFSHSLVFAFLVAPVLGFLLQQMYKNKLNISRCRWTLLFFLSIFTHPLLDAFTVYGTQLFLPFSDYRVALNTISIVDPGYTLPLLIGCIVALKLKKRHALSAARWNKVGLTISQGYLLLTIFNKFVLDKKFENAFERSGIRPTHYMSNPVLFSNLLWYTVAKDDSNCYIGYYSLLQKEDSIPFEKYPIQSVLRNQVKDQTGLKKLDWFSKEYAVMEMQGDTFCYYDIRFGKTDLFADGDNSRTFVFFFRSAHPEKSPLEIEQHIARRDMSFGEFFGQFNRRIFHISPGD